MKLRTATVAELQRQGLLLVQDGNHGEFRPRFDEFVENGVAFIRAADMDSGRVLFDSAAKINDTARRRISKGIGAPGDVLLSHKGTVGKTALVSQDAPAFVCSPQTTFWRTLDEGRLDRKYLYAFLRSPAFHAQLASRAGETDMAPYVSLTSQRGLSVILPPISDQRAIAHILGTLDAKIELDRCMNETLEAMGRAIFKSWFVDFDPVRAKTEGRQPLGMDAETAALFPDSFMDSPLGKIPKGWKVLGLDGVADFRNGLALQKYPADGEESLPVIKIAQLRKGDAEGADRASRTIPPECVVQDGDVLFSWSGSLDARIWCGGAGALNQHLFKVTSKSYPKWFYFYWIREHLPQFQAIASDKATTMGHIQRYHLTEANVLVPGGRLLAAMDKVVSPLVEAARAIKLQSGTLAAIRDALLPKLISGEIRLGDAETVVGRGRST